MKSSILTFPLRSLAIAVAVASSFVQVGSALPNFSEQCGNFCVQTRDTCRLTNSIVRTSSDNSCRDGWGAFSQTNCTQIYSNSTLRHACRQCFNINEQVWNARNAECMWRYSICQGQCETTCDIGESFINLSP